MILANANEKHTPLINNVYVLRFLYCDVLHLAIFVS